MSNATLLPSDHPAIAAFAEYVVSQRFREEKSLLSLDPTVAWPYWEVYYAGWEASERARGSTLSSPPPDASSAPSRPGTE